MGLQAMNTNSPEPAAASRADGLAVAVLPLRILSDDPFQDYCVAGVAVDVVTELAKIPGLRLTSASMLASIQDGARDPRAIGQELGVDRILEGSMRRAGGRVRITAALIDAQSGEQLWAERYNRDLGGFFAVQD